MVRKGIAEETKVLPIVRPDPRFDMDRLWKEHARYWSDEGISCRQRFADAVHKTTIEEAFHIQDRFRIVCDGQVDGEDCGNVIGFAPLPDTHDGLCERCRNRNFAFPPRIAMTKDGIYAMTDDGPSIITKD